LLTCQCTAIETTLKEMLVGDTDVQQVAKVSALQQHPKHYDNTGMILLATTICSCLHIICGLLDDNIVTNYSGPYMKSG